MCLESLLIFTIVSAVFCFKHTLALKYSISFRMQRMSHRVTVRNTKGALFRVLQLSKNCFTQDCF